jgi:hypothetical protein
VDADAQERADAFTFLLTADIRFFTGPPYDSPDYFQGALRAIDRFGRGDFMVSPGDIDPPLRALWAITRTLDLSDTGTYTWYPVIGNHELPGQGLERNRGHNLRWLKGYDYGSVNPGPSGCPTTTYSFDYKNAHFVMLNEYCDSMGPDVRDGDISDHLYDWLADDLRATDQTHLFVFGHEPAYPQPDTDVGRERHTYDSLNAHPAYRDRFWTLLRNEGVVAYFCGHTHNYSAVYIDGVWQVDVGHARGKGDTGAPSTFVAVHVEGDTVTYEARRDRHDGEYDYDDIVHTGTLTPVTRLSLQERVSPTTGYSETRDAFVIVDTSDAGIPTPSPTPTPGVKAGYGISIKGLNYSDDSLEKGIALNLEWAKIYDHPPPERLPFKVLYRVNLPRRDEDWAEWGHYRFLDAQLYADRIDAYEIGNEPNLIEEWGLPPDPAAYAELLKIAYREIKSADPDALVVSAGLAPVAESDDPHHLNDLAFLRGMYEHGAADHFDVLGTHSFGFPYPPETPTDEEVCPQYSPLDGPVLDRGCWSIEGFCFRRVELLREIMREYGDEDKPVWATEFGWIIRPPDCCRERDDWPGRYWQVVSEGSQARYIVRAYAHAERYWPWMEAMFLWNLDYSRYPRKPRDASELDEGCPPCDSMGWYSILNRDGSPRQAYELLLEP